MDKDDDEIVPAGLDTWTAEDQAAIGSREWPEVEAAAARAVDAEMSGAPDTTIKRLWRVAVERNERLNALVRERLSGVLEGARRRIRGARGARAARRARAGKAKAPSSDDGPAGVDAVIGDLTYASDARPFLSALAEIIADALLKEPVS